MAENNQVILASGSPRRAELLARLGVNAQRSPVDLDETQLPGELPEDYVERLSRAKAEAGLAKFPGKLVIGSDTTVVLGEQIFGKPVDKQDYLRMLTLLSGTRHWVLTGVALASDTGTDYRLNRTEVKFREISKLELESYWQTGEPLDKAGAYGIQGMAGVFIEEIKGSYSGVMGLPVAEAEQLLTQAGFNIWQ